MPLCHVRLLSLIISAGLNDQFNDIAWGPVANLEANNKIMKRHQMHVQYVLLGYEGFYGKCHKTDDSVLNAVHF